MFDVDLDKIPLSTRCDFAELLVRSQASFAIRDCIWISIGVLLPRENSRVLKGDVQQVDWLLGCEVMMGQDGNDGAIKPA